MDDDNKIGLKDRLSQMIHTARSATPGPWTHCGQDRGGCQCGLVWSLAIDDTVATANVSRDDTEEVVPVEMVKANASHIAAFAPDVAAALAEVSQEALKAHQDVEAVFRRQPAVHAKTQSEADAWSQAYASLHDVREALERLAVALGTRMP